MLRSVDSLNGFSILAIDGDIGHVHDFYFDDESWTVRYLVVETGNWLRGQKVLLSTKALGRPNWESEQFPVLLTKEQVKNSPDIDTAKPVSRQREIELVSYYDWPTYWSPAGLVTPRHPPASRRQTGMPRALQEEVEMVAQKQEETSLRSANEVMGYHIQATDDEIGHVEDFIADEIAWIIRYMVVDTRNWLPGRKVLVPPARISNVTWDQKKVYVKMTQEAVKNSPEYDPSAPVERTYETRLYDYYRWPPYWL